MLDRLDIGLACQERRARESRLMQTLESGELGKDVAAHLAESDRHPRSDGGALAYLKDLSLYETDFSTN